MSAEDYGRFYWGGILRDGKWIHLYADRVETKDGMVYFLPQKDKPYSFNMAIPADQIRMIFAAEVFEGSPATVEHWDEEPPKRKDCE